MADGSKSKNTGDEENLATDKKPLGLRGIGKVTIRITKHD